MYMGGTKIAILATYTNIGIMLACYHSQRHPRRAGNGHRTCFGQGRLSPALCEFAHVAANGGCSIIAPLLIFSSYHPFEALAEQIILIVKV